MNILLIEDEEAMREAISYGLNRRGHVVTIVENGELGWETFSANPSEFDLILSDIQMPKMDGMELLKRIRKERIDIPFVIMTGHAGLETSIEALKLGAYDFVVKPFKLKELLPTINRLQSGLTSQKQMEAPFPELTGELNLSLPSNSQHIPGVVEYLKLHVAPYCKLHQIDLQKLVLCLHESITNAIVHGNLEVPSSIKEESHAKFDEVLAEREKLPEYTKRIVRIKTSITKEGLSIDIEDQGKGFDASSLPDPNDPMNLLNSGRGILIIRTFMDEVSWNDKGNCVRMTKLF